MNSNPDLTDVARTLLGLRWQQMDELAGMIAGLGTTDRHKVASKIIEWARQQTSEDLPEMGAKE